MIDWESWYDTKDDLVREIVLSENGPTKWVYADETGAFHAKAPYFIIGMVKTTAPMQDEIALRSLCEDYGFEDAEMKYAQTDRRRIELKKKLIEYFFDTETMEYQCIVKPRHFHKLDSYRNRYGVPAQDMAYNHTYCALMKKKLRECASTHLILDDRNRSANDNLIDYLYAQVRPVRSVTPANSRDHRLLQLADILNGAVYGNLTGVEHPAKVAVWQHVRLVGEVFDFSRNRWDEKFGIWHWRPPGT